jgi:hemerythrin-like domain-containing protein
MNDPIAILKRDHREVADLLKKLADTNPGTRRKATVAKVTSELRLHMQIEEDEIYPLVEQKVGAEDAEEAMVEHRLARDGLAQLQELVDEPGFGAVVAMLTAGIRHHVREEETEVFPKLKKKLDRDTLAALGDQVVARKAKTPRKTATTARP